MLSKLKSDIRSIVYSNTSLFDIAFGFGIGVFIGFLPLYGFQTLLSLLAAFLVKRANKISLIVATQLFLPPIIPIVVGINFVIGSYILSGNISIMKIRELSDILLYIKPIFIGSLIAGSFFGIISGYSVYLIMKLIRNKNGQSRKVGAV